MLCTAYNNKFKMNEVKRKNRYNDDADKVGFREIELAKPASK